MSKIKTRKIISFTATELSLLVDCCIATQGDLYAGNNAEEIKRAKKIDKLIDKLNK